MTEYLFLEPLDVLYLRGNRSFGAPGDHAISQMPPWPSLVAGALRSRMLADAGIAPKVLLTGAPPGPLGAVLGSFAQPGAFRVASLALACDAGAGAPQPCMPCPADLFVSDGAPPAYLRPAAARLPSSYPLPLLPALANAERAKPAARWLSATGWRDYLAGRALTAASLLDPAALWKTDPRVGVGLDFNRRAAAEGKLVSTETVALAPGVGLLAGISGAQGQLPAAGVVRLGGDGRGARVRSAPPPPPRDYSGLARLGRLRLITTSPAFFVEGWQLPLPPGLQATLVAAAVPRFEVISGWDLAHWRPKPALRAVPPGAVYWLDGVETSADTLAAIERDGLWPQPLGELRSRQSEGFNAVVFAPWAEPAQ